jgi:hypothetical protein
MGWLRWGEMQERRGEGTVVMYQKRDIHSVRHKANVTLQGQRT